MRMSSSRAENGLYDRFHHPYASLTENGVYDRFHHPYASLTENGLYDRFRHPYTNVTENGLYDMFRYPYPSRTENGLYDRFRHPYARLCYRYYLCFLYIMFPYPYPSRTENGLYMFPYPYPNRNGNALWQIFLPLPQSKWKQSVWQVSPPLSYRNKKSHNLSRIGIRYRFWPIENSPLNLTGRDGRFAWLPYTSSVDLKGSHPSCHHTDPTVIHYSTKTLSLQIMRWWWCWA